MTDTTHRPSDARSAGLAGPARVLLASCLLVLPLAAGCDEPPPPNAPGPATPQTAPATPPGVGSTAPSADAAAKAAADGPWTVPDGWTLDPAPRPMRLATFQAPVGDLEAEIAVSRFDGDVGGELANVNRWRDQLGLGPIDEAQLETEITRFGEGLAPGYSIRVEGEIMHLVAAGVYDPATDRTWFVRVMGAPETIDAVEDDVLWFAGSISTGLAGG